MSVKPSTWTPADDTTVETAIRSGASRRDLLRMLAAGGLSLSTAGAILGQSRPAMAAPSKGGHLKIAGFTGSTADTLDPARGSNSTDYTRCIALYDRLTNLDANSNLVMELAEAIDTADAKVWTIKLRRGVTFHDGKPFTAADVIFTLKRHLDPATGSKVSNIAKQMTGFKTVDDHTVEVTLASANADLPTIFTLQHFLIVADGTTDFAKGNGTGPFILQSFEPGVRSLMRRNDSYWKTGGGPYVDSFEQFPIADDTARINALLSGDVHIAAAINPRAMRQLENKPGFTMVRSPSNSYNDINVRLDMSPGDKADFVLGMKSLVNRETILRSALRGQGSLGNDQPVFPGNPLRNDALKPRAFDPDKAKFHLNKAGMIGQTIAITASDAVGSSVDMAMILQSDAAPIGLKIDVQRVPSDGYWDKYWLKAPIHFGNNNYRPTPDILFSTFYASNAPWNESRYKSEKFDQMLVEARGELDQAKRKEMYGEMQTMVSDDAGTIIPAYNAGIDALNAKVKGLVENPLGGLSGYRAPALVWFEG